MWLRLLLFILLYVGCIGGGGYLLVSGARRLYLGSARRRHQLQGRKNQKLLMEHKAETCCLCLEHVDPNKDPYDEKVGGWYHDSCLEDLVNDRR